MRCFGFLVLCLVDASAAMQVRALKDYCNNYDLTSLNIKAGDIITVHRFPPKYNTFFNNDTLPRWSREEYSAPNVVFKHLQYDLT